MAYLIKAGKMPLKAGKMPLKAGKNVPIAKN